MVVPVKCVGWQSGPVMRLLPNGSQVFCEPQVWRRTKFYSITLLIRYCVSLQRWYSPSHCGSQTLGWDICAWQTGATTINFVRYVQPLHSLGHDSGHNSSISRIRSTEQSCRKCFHCDYIHLPNDLFVRIYANASAVARRMSQIWGNITCWSAVDMKTRAKGMAICQFFVNVAQFVNQYGLAVSLDVLSSQIVDWL